MCLNSSKVTKYKYKSDSKMPKRNHIYFKGRVDFLLLTVMLPAHESFYFKNLRSQRREGQKVRFCSKFLGMLWGGRGDEMSDEKPVAGMVTKQRTQT